MNKIKNTVCFDVETTGLNPVEDEILQLSAINEEGEVLLNEFIRPSHVGEWPEAEAVHGISPRDVADCPEMKEIVDKVQDVFSNAGLLVGYNGTFDIEFLKHAGIEIPDVAVVDVMKDFAPIWGDWNDYWEDYKWTTLANCAKHYGYEFKAHDSLEDVRATLFCHYAMQDDPEFLKIRGRG